MATVKWRDNIRRGGARARQSEQRETGAISPAVATVPESDFSMPFIFGYRLRLSSAVPPRQQDGMETSQVPVQCVRTWVLRHRGIPTPLAKRPSATPQRPRHPELSVFSVLNSPAHTRPCQRLTFALMGGGP